jgi:predicted HAD superfamily Cof-like phosphohydrolase
MLLEFHRSFGATTNVVPTVPSKKDRGMRHSIVTEELLETEEALTEEKFDEFVDGLIDSLYVLVGTNVTYGLETVEPIYRLPSRAPSFPDKSGKHLIAGMLDGMRRVAGISLGHEEGTMKPEWLPSVQLCMNKLISDCLSILYLCGVDTMHVFAEVHLANMRKLGPDGLPIKRDDGKVMKPEGWQPPDIQRVLDEQTRRFDYPLPGVG